MNDPVSPYAMARTETDGVVGYTFTPRGRTDTLDLNPADFQSGAKMRAYVMAWIATLD